jgi:hypothetical protein
MDDRDLEARLRGHLHRRFDAAPVPYGLAASVREGMAPVAATRVGFGLRASPFQVGWATLAIALVVGALVLVQNTLGPASPRSTATPAPTATGAQERWFVVLPAELTLSKGEASLATDVLDARMRALGYGNFSSFGGYGIGFEMAPDGSASAPSDEATRRVLTATGHLEIVPLPPADYGDGGLVAEVGKPLPKQEPALFGWDGIESFAAGTDQQSRTTLVMTLKPTARQAFAEYTAAHASESIALVIDGVVASVPIINEPIPGGEVAISSGGAPGSTEEQRFREWAAILIGGMLPEHWQDATSPALITPEQATAIALRSYPTATAAAIDMYFSMHGTEPDPLWRIELNGTFAFTCGEPDPSACPSSWTSIEVLLDALTGQVLMGAPPS